MRLQHLSDVRRAILWIIVCGLIGLMVFLVGRLIINQTSSKDSVTIGSSVFKAEVVSSDKDIKKGLSGRDSLKKSEAMLFKFDSDGEWPIWMKDMNFPIDIIWIDRNGKVVHVEHDISPSTYPDQTFKSPKPARYVLEVSAGQARQSGVRSGTETDFNMLREDK